MTAIVSNKGELLFNIQASDEIVRLNTPEDCIAVEDPPNSNMFYQDGWVDMPFQPSSNHIFDYSLKQWVDTRSIEQVKTLKWRELKIERDTLEEGGFSFSGNTYDSDQVSQGRILGAFLAGTDQTWTLADNSTVHLTVSQLKDLYLELQNHISTIHERGRIARSKINEATSVAEIESIVI